MAIFTFEATIEIEADNLDDARIDLIEKMDAHDIDWEESQE